MTTLPTDYESGDTGHVEAHNTTNGEVNTKLNAATPFTSAEAANAYDAPNSMAVAEFAEDQPVLAWQLEGDAFPRVVMLSDPTDTFVSLSDGTFDPLDEETALGFYRSGALVTYGDLIFQHPSGGPVCGLGQPARLTWDDAGRLRVAAVDNADGTETGNEYVYIAFAQPPSAIQQQPSPLDPGDNMSVGTYNAPGVAMAIQHNGDDYPRWLMMSNAGDGLYMSTGISDPYDGASLNTNDDGEFVIHAASGQVIKAVNTVQCESELWLRSPDDSLWSIKVANDGTLSAVPA